KMDGSAKGGGALSACSATNSKVYFMGVGEHLDDFEEFNAERFVSRLIGFGDLEGLLEKAKEVEFDEEAAKRMMSGKFTLEDVYSQIEQMRQMGPMKKVMEMMGMGAMPEGMAEQSEEKMKRFKVIMDSMTPTELEQPELIKATRIKRIAAGSGSEEKDVKELLKQFDASKKMLKQLKSGKMKNLQGMMKRFQSGGLKM
ncbi:signal recognition particle protein Srp19, partial [Candidatus Micrarchaeota archaeon]|nr:signal recognition particle protein Srp19 [Candidatus Micrarchaeota archaeon]